MGAFGACKNKDVTAQIAEYARVVSCSFAEKPHPRPYDIHRQAVSDRLAKTALLVTFQFHLTYHQGQIAGSVGRTERIQNGFPDQGGDQRGEHTSYIRGVCVREPLLCSCLSACMCHIK